MKGKRKKKKKRTVIKKIKKHFKNDSSFSLFEVIIIILISVILGVIIGYLLTYGNSNLSRVRSNSYLGEVVNTYNSIVDDYYENLDEDRLSEFAIKGMLSSLDDPYSTFLDDSLTAEFNQSLEGQYTSIGVTFSYDDGYSYISSVVEEEPASQAGLMEGDIILSIDGYDCHDLDPDQLNTIINRSIGASLKIDVLREEEQLTFTVKKEAISIQNVTSRLISEEDKMIGYIKINLFSSHIYDQFSEELHRLEKKNIDSLIIDLRDNPGGHLEQARKILSMFFSKKTVLYQIEKNGSKQKIYSLNNDVRKYPIVVLINGETASSAEVMASCFQDNYKKIHLVGTKTYGKGSIQKTISLRNGSSIKFTVETWLTPIGINVNQKGIIPDIEVDQDSDYEMDDDDMQLQMAISILK